MLLSETHSTGKTYINIPNYNIFSTNHPDSKAHGGTAVIIKKKHQVHRARWIQKGLHTGYYYIDLRHNGSNKYICSLLPA